ncbi:hypothetical protein CANINC_004996 [Pichia inconspicua]|uniref:Palmitoyltransferase n=1 Tax=Pichia inconspicua TaxID=52247 RepID=A0A4T0WVY6_9ASCO|nr:hypothetical protein CANINC_004996 [[Candida] inconspicua]
MVKDEPLVSLEDSNMNLAENDSQSNLSISSMNVLTDTAHGENNLDANDSNNDANIIKQLITAAQCGNLEILKSYLEKSPSNPTPLSPNTTDSDGITLVHWAALNNRLEIIKYLVSKGADPDVPAGDMNATPLLWAARYGLVYIVDYLIREAHADYSIVDKNGIGIHLASVFSSNVMMVIYALWTINELKDSKNTEIDGVNTADPTGRTLLHWAAYQGDFLTVDVLINAGAKVDLLDSEGFTPLHWALVNGSKSVVSSLLAANSDVTLKTGNGRSTWDIATDMKHNSMWNSILKEFFRDPTSGEKLNILISKDTATFLAFFIPYITLPLVLLILTSNLNIYFKLLLTLALIIFQQQFLKRVVIPAISQQKITLLKSPFFAGVFSSTAYWCIVTWFFKMGISTLKTAFFSNIIFSLTATATIVCFIKAMTMDPGYIPSNKDPLIVKEIIFQLLETRSFDSNHFCIHSNIKKPLRAKFSREAKLNIARFDHYCPWVNNNIGVRNHKVFFAFAVALTLGILSWLNITLTYFKTATKLTDSHSCIHLSEALCEGYYGSPFMLGLFWWVSLQAVWLTFLVIVQFFQISKGYTTYEFSHKHKHESHNNNFSSVPPDDSNDKNIDNDETNDELTNLTPSTMNTTVRVLSKILDSKFCKMVGLDQLLFITTDIIERKMKHFEKNNFDFGFRQNWIDFLFLKRTNDPISFKSLISLPLHGEGNINGYLVDYYKLYEVPQQA